MPEITESPELERKSMLRDIDIPGVKDRDPDPTAGPRLAVKEFRVQGLVEYPDLGITRKAIKKLVESIRFDLMAEDKLLESGYTIDELGGLSDLLVDIEEDTVKRHVTPIEVQKLVWLIREQRKKRGITLGQIEAIADRITKFYRERGFILAKAYIPKQEVRDGIVTLTLLLGILGNVEVNKNNMYSTSTLKSVFDSSLTKPVTSEQIEENLYLINDFPGISVNGFFEPGHQVGDTKLNINVKKESRYKYNFRLDNHGTKATGLYRAYLDFQVNNPLGNADLINASILNASSPSNTQFWRLFYQTKLFSPRIKLSIGTSENQFIVDKSDLGTSQDLSGTVNVQDVGLRYDIKRSRKNNAKLELKYETIASDLLIGTFSSGLNEKVNNLSLIYSFDSLNEKSRRLHQGAVKVTTAKIGSEVDKGQDSDYQVYSLDYTILGFVKVPLFDSTSRLIIRSALQYTGKKISSVSRSGLAGPTRARAYSSDVFSADDALFLGIDWVFNAPSFIGDYKDIFKPFVFADYSYGNQYSVSDGINTVTGQLADIGFGFQVAYKHNLSGNLLFAFPMFDKFSDPDVKIKENDSRVVFDFQYKF